LDFLPQRDHVAAASALEDEFDPVGLPGTHLPSVGALLREAREAAGGDLGRIGATLRIRPDHLRAIEAGNYADLPAPAYAIGFIRSYAKHLGLDAAEMVHRFKQESAGQHRAHELAFPEPLRERRVPLGGALVGLAILALCAFGAWHLSADRRDRDATPAVASSPALVAPPPNAVPSPARAAKTTDVPIEALSSLSPAAGPPSPPQVHSESAAYHRIEVSQALRPEPPAKAAASAGAGAATSAPSPSTDAAHVFGVAGDGHFRIALRATAETWLEVKDGDTSIFKRLLEAGDEYRLPEKPGLTLRIGNARGIEVLVDGKPLPSAAQPSQGHRTVVTLEARELLAKAGMQ
jgi:cytoskeleton protein RodZ